MKTKKSRALRRSMSRRQREVVADRFAEELFKFSGLMLRAFVAPKLLEGNPDLAKVFMGVK